jgi:hypothetical protein
MGDMSQPNQNDPQKGYVVSPEPPLTNPSTSSQMEISISSLYTEYDLSLSLYIELKTSLYPGTSDYQKYRPPAFNNHIQPTRSSSPNPLRRISKTIKINTINIPPPPGVTNLIRVSHSSHLRFPNPNQTTIHTLNCVEE